MVTVAVLYHFRDQRLVENCELFCSCIPPVFNVPVGDDSVSV